MGRLGLISEPRSFCPGSTHTVASHVHLVSTAWVTGYALRMGLGDVEDKIPPYGEAPSRVSSAAPARRTVTQLAWA